MERNLYLFFIFVIKSHSNGIGCLLTGSVPVPVPESDLQQPISNFDKYDNYKVPGEG